VFTFIGDIRQLDIILNKNGMPAGAWEKKLHFLPALSLYMFLVIREMDYVKFTEGLTRIFHRVSSRGGASGRGYKARAVRATQGY